MKEKDFQKRIKASMTEQGIWCHNLADMPRSGDIEENGQKKTFRFIPEKPGDLFGAYKFYPFLIECKMIRKFGKIPNTILCGSKDRRLGRPFDEWHQVVELDRFSQNGTAFLFLCYYLTEPRRNFIIPLSWYGMRDMIKQNRLYITSEHDLPCVHYKKGYDFTDFKRTLRTQ